MRNEKELLSRARRLDKNSLIEIYQRYSPGLYRFAARILGDRDLAEDCVSETFSRFIESLYNGGGPYEHLQAYLYQIAHNWITDQFRKNLFGASGLSSKIGNNGNDPAQIVQEKMELDRVRSVLALMTPEQRQVIILKYLEGWSNQEIADSLGKSVGAVRVLHHRGVVQLKQLLRTAERIL
jgi:RNA polymerase sigma-70 factor (ECF subfamily)